MLQTHFLLLDALCLHAPVCLSVKVGQRLIDSVWERMPKKLFFCLTRKWEGKKNLFLFPTGNINVLFMMTARCKKNNRTKNRPRRKYLVCKGLSALMTYNCCSLYPASNVCVCVESPLHQWCWSVRNLWTLYSLITHIHCWCSLLMRDRTGILKQMPFTKCTTGSSNTQSSRTHIHTCALMAHLRFRFGITSGSVADVYTKATTSI